MGTFTAMEGAFPFNYNRQVSTELHQLASAYRKPTPSTPPSTHALTHTYNSLLEALSIPVQQRNSAYKTFLGTEQDSYEKEEAIPPSSRTVLLCGFQPFVGSIRV